MESFLLSMDTLKDVPGFQIILKTVVRSLIQNLLQQLSEHTSEEYFLLTANMNDGSLSHIGSGLGREFICDQKDIRSQFLRFCLKAHQGQWNPKEHSIKERSEKKSSRACQKASDKSTGFIPVYDYVKTKGLNYIDRPVNKSSRTCQKPVVKSTGDIPVYNYGKTKGLSNTERQEFGSSTTYQKPNVGVPVYEYDNGKTKGLDEKTKGHDYDKIKAPDYTERLNSSTTCHKLNEQPAVSIPVNEYDYRRTKELDITERTENESSTINQKPNDLPTIPVYYYDYGIKVEEDLQFECDRNPEHVEAIHDVKKENNESDDEPVITGYDEGNWQTAWEGEGRNTALERTDHVVHNEEMITPDHVTAPLQQIAPVNKAKASKLPSKKKKILCPFPGCGKKLVNIRNHCRKVHKNYPIPARRSKMQKKNQQKLCPIQGCNIFIKRVDKHLVKIHHQTKGSEAYLFYTKLANISSKL